MVQRLEAVRPNRIPPHNLDAEQSVLGAMLESKDAIANVIEILESEHFYKPAHVEIYETVLALYARGEAVDAITCADELARRGKLDAIGGKPYIHGLLEAYPTASSAAYYAHIVEELSLLRNLIDAGNKVQEIGFSMPEDIAEAVNEAEELVFNVGDKRLKDDYHEIRKLLMKSMTDIEARYDSGANLTGISSGFPDLDDKTSGFQPSNLIIVAARPSMGKSSLLNDFALHVASKQKLPVLIFTLEMSRDEVVKRFLSSEAKVDAQKLNKGALQEQDWTRLSAALGRLAEAPIFIDDSANINLMEIRAKCRRLKAKHGLGMVVIDYLQLMQSPRKSENRQQEVSEISRNLKILARELQVPVLCASQLNRGVEMRADKRPLLGDLRESGCLTGDTRITRADNGSEVTIGELVSTGARDIPVWAMDEHGKMVSSTMTHAFSSGVKDIYRLKLISGPEVRASANHPFFSFDGWKQLQDIAIGERLAIPRRLPTRNQETMWFDRQVTRQGLNQSPTSRQPDGGLAQALIDRELCTFAGSDLFWDEVQSIEYCGREEVFDATVTETHNFVANGIIAHNSIEQDSDLVMFIYRDEVYNPDTEARGEAELILAKHRNGPTGTIRLAFMNQYTKFASIARSPG